MCFIVRNEIENIVIYESKLKDNVKSIGNITIFIQYIHIYNIQYLFIDN